MIAMAKKNLTKSPFRAHLLIDVLSGAWLGRDLFEIELCAATHQPPPPEIREEGEIGRISSPGRSQAHPRP
jgi:hypothetical protein